jgi:hypothetical protein
MVLPSCFITRIGDKRFLSSILLLGEAVEFQFGSSTPPAREGAASHIPPLDFRKSKLKNILNILNVNDKN